MHAGCMGEIRLRMLVVASVLLLTVSGCSAGDSVVVGTAPEDTGSGPGSTVDATEFDDWWAPSDAAPETIATGLESPWSVIPYEDGYLVSQRDDGAIVHVDTDGSTSEVGEVKGVTSGGESGLHGLALLEDGDDTYLYAYHGAEADNRVVRMRLEREDQGLMLGPSETIVTGIPRADTHNGGRIHFGPDGYLHISTGDAQQRDAAQDEETLGGKILRVDAIGNPAPDNPFGNEVYSLGHRNVQGFAWTSDGTMWASEFGQNTWDELNRIEPGGNYGWPIVEGIAEDDRFIDPLIQWSPAEASPSGLASKGDSLFLATLRGRQLWIIDTADGGISGQPVAVIPEGVDARLRDATLGTDGNLLILTNNTDGRANPGPEDDRLVLLTLEPSG